MELNIQHLTKIYPNGVKALNDVSLTIPKGIFGLEGPVIYKERRLIRQKENTFKVIVDKKPAKAGIDPYLLLVDRVPDDNLKTTVKN